MLHHNSSHISGDTFHEDISHITQPYLTLEETPKISKINPSFNDSSRDKSRDFNYLLDENNINGTRDLASSEIRTSFEEKMKNKFDRSTTDLDASHNRSNTKRSKKENSVMRSFVSPSDD